MFKELKETKIKKIKRKHDDTFSSNRKYQEIHKKTQWEICRCKF